MLPYQNDHYSSGMESVLNRNSLFEEPNSMMKPMGGVSRSQSESQKQKLQEAAKKKHAFAEQLRRQRIRAHIDTLRHLLIQNNFKPPKTAKASILTETVRHVKQLKKRAADVAFNSDSEKVSGSFMFPGEDDEVAVSYCEGEEGKIVKAMLCCEDRPGLNRELTGAIRSVGARVVRAETATVGGRTKAEVVVQWLEGGGRGERRGGGGEEDVWSLRRALKALVESRALGCSRLGKLMLANGRSGLDLSRSTAMWNGKGFF